MSRPARDHLVASPAALPACRVLLSVAEVDEAARRARELRLVEHPVRTKYWDNMLAVAEVRHLRDEPLVDLGCRTGVLLTWLDQLGFRRLYGCDLRQPWPPIRSWLALRMLRPAIAGARMWLRHRSRMRRAPVEDTGFPENFFAAATCMSVIEHGVNLEAFFREAARLLRPGGILVLSTDYWPEPIQGPPSSHFHDRPDVVFDQAGLRTLAEMADSAGLESPRLDLTARERVVHWHGRDYTFAYLVFRKAD